MVLLQNFAFQWPLLCARTPICGHWLTLRLDAGFYPVCERCERARRRRLLVREMNAASCTFLREGALPLLRNVP